jgi:hypothetical protein
MMIPNCLKVTIKFYKKVFVIKEYELCGFSFLATFYQSYQPPNFFIDSFCNFFNGFKISIIFSVFTIPLLNFCEKNFLVILSLFANFDAKHA